MEKQHRFDLDELERLQGKLLTYGALRYEFDKDEKEYCLLDESDSVLASIYDHGTPGETAHSLAAYLAALANAAPELIRLARRGQHEEPFRREEADYQALADHIATLQERIFCSNCNEDTDGYAHYCTGCGGTL